jgi:hypothetical protein
MNSFWAGLRVHRVEADALAEFGDPARLFRNLNDPGEYRSARQDAD